MQRCRKSRFLSETLLETITNKYDSPINDMNVLKTLTFSSQSKQHFDESTFFFLFCFFKRYWKAITSLDVDFSRYCILRVACEYNKIVFLFFTQGTNIFFLWHWTKWRLRDINNQNRKKTHWFRHLFRITGLTVELPKRRQLNWLHQLWVPCDTAFPLDTNHQSNTVKRT